MIQTCLYVEMTDRYLAVWGGCFDSVPLTAALFCPHTGAAESFAMATKIVTFRCQEEQMDQMSHGMEMSSQIKKKKFKSR